MAADGHRHPQRDRDTCANIFDAMESVAKIKYNRPNDTFGQVKNYIEQNNLLRPEVINVLTALNQLRNQNFGHGMAVQFNLSGAEVDFVYLTCISAILLQGRVTFVRRLASMWLSYAAPIGKSTLGLPRLLSMNLSLISPESGDELLRFYCSRGFRPERALFLIHSTL